MSHAVGCAFGICLENKQKREKMSVSVNYNDKEASFTRMGTFKAVSIKDRLADPQAVKPCESPKLSTTSSERSEENIAGVQRPKPSDVMYQRQASFRGLGQLSGNTPFKRGGKGSASLRLNDLPSNKDRLGVSILSDSPILEDIELPASNLEEAPSSQSSNKAIDLLTSDELADIDLTNQNPVFGHLTSAGPITASGSSTPVLVPDTASTASNYSMSPPPSLLQPLKLTNQSSALTELTSEEPIKVVNNDDKSSTSDSNPWDSVPDQPQSSEPSSSLSLLPASSADSWLNSLTSSITSQQLISDTQPSILQNYLSSNSENYLSSTPAASKLSVDVQNSSKSNGTSSGYNSPSSTGSEVGNTWNQPEVKDTWQTEVNKSILEDPFDAEWAAIATRNSSVIGDPEPATNSNPFLGVTSSESSAVKAFELKL